MQITEEPEMLRIAWDNRTVPKDRPTFWFFLLFSLVWIPGTVAITVIVFLADVPLLERIPFVAGCFLAWIGAYGVVHTLAMRRWSEWVEVSPREVTIGATGFLTRMPRTFPIEAIQWITLDWYDNGRGHQSNVTLVLYRKAAPRVGRGIHFGYWLSPDLKRQVYETILAFVEDRGIPLEIGVHGEFPGGLFWDETSESGGPDE